MAILVRLVSSASTALTPSTALTLVKADGHTTTTSEVSATLERIVSAGRAFRHPSGSRSAAPAHAYGRQPPDAFVTERLQEAVRTGTEFSLTDLRRPVTKAYAGLVDEAIGDLLREGKLFEKPGGGKTKKYTTKPLPPTSVLTAAQRSSLDTTLTKVNAFRAHPLRLIDLLNFLDGPSVDATTGSERSSERALTLELLKELYRLDLPSRGGLTSMPIPMTWRRYAKAVEAEGGAPDRAGFERVLLDSAAAGRIEVTPHEWPATLPAEDVAASIRRPDGRVLYYWRPIRG